jgi:hypothetical protein
MTMNTDMNMNMSINKMKTNMFMNSTWVMYTTSQQVPC